MPTLIDLFSGCGGLTEGFLQTPGYDCLAHVEWDAAALQVLRHRLLHHGEDPQRALHFDIQRLQELFTGVDADEVFGPHPGLNALVDNRPVDLVIGGPPCQAYSLAGRIRDEHGMQDDYRNFLFESFVGVLKQYRPRAFLFENVVGMLSAAPGGIPIVDRIRSAFDDAGYATAPTYRECLFDLSQHGVPQRRRRVILLGLDRTKFSDPTPIFNRFYSRGNDALIPRSPPTSVQDAIGHLAPLAPLSTPNHAGGARRSHSDGPSNDPSHQPRYHNERDIETFRILTRDLADGTNAYASTEAIRQLYTERTGRTASVHKYHVLRPDEPSNTIPAHLHKDGLRHIHWDPVQARSITVREAACLQGFPLDFEFPVSNGAAYKMIGNAVPPTFASRLAIAMLEVLSSS